MGESYLTEYDAAWPEAFAQIERHLRQSGIAPERIEHVGSTSVVGMVAKPIIDIDLVVAEGAMPETIAALERAGYAHTGDQGIPGREAFKPVGDAARALPGHHLYACEAGAEELRRHLAFRDYLRAHPEEEARLSDLKRRLAFHEGLSRAEYIEAKGPMVREILVAALAWYQS